MVNCEEMIPLLLFQGSAAFWYDLTSVGYREQRSIHGGTLTHCCKNMKKVQELDKYFSLFSP